MKIIVDASNVLYHDTREGKAKNLARALSVCVALLQDGHKVFCILDRSVFFALKAHPEQQNAWKDLKKRYHDMFIESDDKARGEDSDPFIIEAMRSQRCFAVTNDAFKNHREADTFAGQRCSFRTIGEKISIPLLKTSAQIYPIETCLLWFDLLLRSKSISIKSSSGSYVACEMDSSKFLVANRPSTSQWEHFKIHTTSTGLIAIAAPNGKWVSVDSRRDGILVAEADRIGQAEIFKLETRGHYNTFKAYNELYVSRREELGGLLKAVADKVNDWELFALEDR